MVSTPSRRSDSSRISAPVSTWPSPMLPGARPLAPWAPGVSGVVVWVISGGYLLETKNPCVHSNTRLLGRGIHPRGTTRLDRPAPRQPDDPLVGASIGRHSGPAYCPPAVVFAG